MDDKLVEMEALLQEAVLALNIALRAAALAGLYVCVDLSEAPAPTHCAQVVLQFPIQE